MTKVAAALIYTPMALKGKFFEFQGDLSPILMAAKEAVRQMSYSNFYLTRIDEKSAKIECYPKSPLNEKQKAIFREAVTAKGLLFGEDGIISLLPTIAQPETEAKNESVTDSRIQELTDFYKEDSSEVEITEGEIPSEETPATKKPKK